MFQDLLSIFDYYIRVPLTSDISIERLNVNVVLGILRWVLLLFEFIDLNVILIYVSLLFCSLDSVNTSVSTISTNINSIPLLNSTNFKDWKENVMIVITCTYIDLVLRIEHPMTFMDKSFHLDKRNFEKWDC